MSELVFVVRYLLLPVIDWPIQHIHVETDVARVWRRGRFGLGHSIKPAVFGEWSVWRVGPVERVHWRIPKDKYWRECGEGDE